MIPDERKAVMMAGDWIPNSNVSVAWLGPLLVTLGLLAIPACTGGDGGTTAGVSASSTTTGGMGGFGGSGTTSSSSGVGGSGGTLGQGPLVDRGLVVRYFINEADNGQSVTELTDSAPDPLPLALTYTPELFFAQDGNNRALQWTGIEFDGRASIPVDGTKIITALQGSKTGTIEVVIDIDQVTDNSSRISHIGFDSESGQFTLASTSASRLQFRWQSSTLGGEWPVDLKSLGRAVVHLVLDTSQAAAEDRVRLYVNASPLARIGGSFPSLNQVINLTTGTHYVLGNREIGGRSFLGKLYYAAMYSEALTSEEVLENAATLLNGDDGP